LDPSGWLSLLACRHQELRTIRYEKFDRDESAILRDSTKLGGRQALPASQVVEWTSEALDGILKRNGELIPSALFPFAMFDMQRIRNMDKIPN
jgi:hypothetical protein